MSPVLLVLDLSMSPWPGEPVVVFRMFSLQTLRPEHAPLIGNLSLCKAVPDS